MAAANTKLYGPGWIYSWPAILKQNLNTKKHKWPAGTGFIINAPCNEDATILLTGTKVTVWAEVPERTWVMKADKFDIGDRCLSENSSKFEINGVKHDWDIGWPPNLLTCPVSPFKVNITEDDKILEVTCDDNMDGKRHFLVVLSTSAGRTCWVDGNMFNKFPDQAELLKKWEESRSPSPGSSPTPYKIEYLACLGIHYRHPDSSDSDDEERY